MKAPLKYAIYSLLYASENGIWEYNIYGKLKKHYNARAICKIKSILIELSNKNWIDEVDSEVYGETIFRKFKLQERHREFVDYHLSPLKIIEELGLDVAKGEVENATIAI